jgi:hypothetical protein
LVGQKIGSDRAETGGLLAVSRGHEASSSRFVNALLKNDTNHVLYIY